MEVYWITSHHLSASAAVAEAIARREAGMGHDTLLTSIQEPWWLEQQLGLRDLANPTKLDDHLEAVTIATEVELERHWHIVSELFSKMLTAANFSQIDSNQLAVTPWMRAPATGLKLETLHSSGRWTRIVVDCGPLQLLTASLTYAESMEWFNSRWGTRMKRLNAFANITLGKVMPLPLPDAQTIAKMEKLHLEMLDLSKLLRQQATIVPVHDDSAAGQLFGEQVEIFGRLYEFPVSPHVSYEHGGDAPAYSAAISEMAANDRAVVLQAASPLVNTKEAMMEIRLELELEPQDLHVHVSDEEVTIQIRHFRRQIALPDNCAPDDLQRVSFTAGILRLEFGS